MTIAFRVVYVAVLGGLVLLWYLDFEPKRLAALIEPAIEVAGSDRAAPQEDTAPGATGAATPADGVEQRLAQLDAKVTAMAARLPPAAAPGARDDQLGELAARLGAIESAVVEIASRPEPVREIPPPDLSGLERRLAELGRQVADLAQRPAVPAGLDGLEERLAAVEAGLARIARRPALALDPARLDAGLASLGARLDGMAAQTGEIEARLAELAQRAAPAEVAAGLAERLAALDARLAEIATRPAPVPDTGAIEARLEAIEAGLTAQPEPVLDTSALEARLETRLDTLDARLAEIATRPAPVPDTGAIEARLEAIETGLADVAARPGPELDTSAIEARVGEIAGRLLDIESRLSAVDAADLEGQIGAVLARLDAMAERPPPQLDTSAIEAGVAELETRIAALDERLAAITGLLQDRTASEPEPQAEATAPEPAETGAADGMAIRTTGEAWVRLRDGARVIFEGLLPAGGRLAVPGELAAPELRAGNAGAVFVVVDGVVYGPLGRPRQVVRNLALRPSEIRARLPRAAPGALAGAGAG